MESIRQRIATERAEAVAKLTAAGVSGTPPDPLLSWRIEYLDLEKDFWSTRSESLSRQDSASRKAALSTLAEMKNRVDDWMEIARLRIAGATASAAELDPGELRDAIQRAGKMQRLIAFTIADLEGGHLKTPVLDRVSSALLALWNTEICWKTRSPTGHSRTRCCGTRSRSVPITDHPPERSRRHCLPSRTNTDSFSITPHRMSALKISGRSRPPSESRTLKHVPSLNGTTGVGPLVIDFDQSFSEIFDNLEMAAALQFEARNGRWGFIADGFCAELGYRHMDTDNEDGAFTYDVGETGICTGLHIRF